MLNQQNYGGKCKRAAATYNILYIYNLRDIRLNVNHRVPGHNTRISD